MRDLFRPLGCRGATIAGLTVLLYSLGASVVAATDYFVRTDGDDAAKGDSIEAAWRTIQRVNQAALRPGDRVLFEAAESFVGNLLITAEDAGRPDAPVVIGSRGSGRAVLLAGQGTGVTVENAGGLVIQDLVIRGAGCTNNSGYGLRCDHTLTHGQRLQHLRIENVETRGFGIFGILVSGNAAGFEHVLVTNCVMRDNLRGGMEIAGRLPWDSPLYAHADVRVTHCQAYDNTGDPAYLKSHSGSGMVLYQVDGGRIDHCRAWGNGALCRSEGGGGVGIWTCASRRVMIEHCESFANRTSARDGGGFDIDGGSIECVLQYNYSHDNDGPGLMAYTYPYASHTDSNNVIRFNVSDHDSRKSRGYAGLWVCNDGKGMSGLEVYNNTVRGGSWTDQAAFVHGDGVEARFRNNLLLTSGTALPLRVHKPTTKLRFEQNLYWREGAPVQVQWGQEVHTTLDSWRAATGQESLHGKALGFFADPQLPDSSAAQTPSAFGGSGPLSAFKPARNSRLLTAGLAIPFEPSTKQTDILGHSLAKGVWPIGALGSSFD